MPIPQEECLILAKQGLFLQKTFREIVTRRKISTNDLLLETSCPWKESLLTYTRALFPHSDERLIQAAAMNTDVLGRTTSQIDLPNKNHLSLRNHPILPKETLDEIARLMRLLFYKTSGAESALLIHMNEPPSTEPGRQVVSAEDVTILWPEHLFAERGKVVYQMGEEFCPSCRVTYPELQETCDLCGDTTRILNLIITAHSHGRSPAFFSNIDDRTSVPHVGFHMTVGDLPKNLSFCLSFCDGSHRFPLQVNDLFQEGTATEELDITDVWLSWDYEEQKEDVFVPVDMLETL